MGMFADFWDKFLDILPLDRWVKAIGNVLKGISFAFVLLWILVFALIVNEWGFTAEQRIWLIIGLLIIMFLLVIILVLLAMHQRDPLYNPQERSLGRGKIFGTEKRPRTKREAVNLPPQPQREGLPPPPESEERPERPRLFR